MRAKTAARAAAPAAGYATTPEAGQTVHTAVSVSPIFSASRSIGDILVANGRLTQDSAQQILEYQQAHHVPFGEAALALRLLTKEDIDFALSQQYDYAYLSTSNTSLSPMLLAAYQPFGAVSESMRAVRSQLMLRWLNKPPENKVLRWLNKAGANKVLAIVSPRTGDGRSFVASNLAIVFAQQGQRTLLIDADLRAKPEQGQQAMFKLGKNFGLSGILANRAGMEVATLVPGLPNLAVIPAGANPPNPQELLGRLAFGNLLEAANQQFDVVLIDTPAGSVYADSEIIAARARNALMVSRRNATRIPDVIQLAQRLQSSGVELIGSVLNDA
ncbi:chain length determinant protein tyrosine kinase EpsG [Candidatus Symbiobacter mobilis]|uniref:non-specific protein-tyrosine kinase n=1 Tax=Candidatus Symbiobacter mobilis CR TaxID=946483 RepID=U5NB50_9BURK|nr:chain length determinant protein tyrosine kinase EpsG [Candidatus Symbiobacter mobilis]AGX87458.1 protein-tyrosine kinase [Candidatus Symbiobacter mobilis CR]